jgi:hypothetical protein
MRFCVHTRIKTEGSLRGSVDIVEAAGSSGTAWAPRARAIAAAKIARARDAHVHVSWKGSPVFPCMYDAFVRLRCCQCVAIHLSTITKKQKVRGLISRQENAAQGTCSRECLRVMRMCVCIATYAASGNTYIYIYIYIYTCAICLLFGNCLVCTYVCL